MQQEVSEITMYDSWICDKCGEYIRRDKYFQHYDKCDGVDK